MGNRSDDFNRFDSAAAMGTPSDGGSAWAAQGGSVWGISTNRGYKPNTANAWEVATLEASTTSVDVQVTVETYQLGAGVVARCADNSNYLMVHEWDAPYGFRVFKVVAGSFTQLGSTYGSTSASGDVVKLTVDGSNNIKAYLNGTLRVDAGSDAAGSSNTKHGLVSHMGGLTTFFDTFSITDTAGAAAASFSRRSAFPLSVLNL